MRTPSFLQRDRRGIWPLILGFLRRYRLADLAFPLQHTPGRIAVIGGSLRIGRNMRKFEDGETAALCQWNPDALVASPREALRLAQAAGALQLSTAIIVVTTADESGFSTEDRDTLWHAFGVPVFEQRRSPDGRLIAWECEVHDGLHVEGNLVAEPAEGEELVNEECECGNLKPRLRPISSIEKAEADAAD